MLVTLAADATRFTDAVARARTLARVADQLWESDEERARALFRAAWDAAGIAEKEVDERYEEFWRKQEIQHPVSVLFPRHQEYAERFYDLRPNVIGAWVKNFLEKQLKERGELAELFSQSAWQCGPFG